MERSQLKGYRTYFWVPQKARWRCLTQHISSVNFGQGGVRKKSLIDEQLGRNEPRKLWWMGSWGLFLSTRESLE